LKANKDKPGIHVSGTW